MPEAVEGAAVVDGAAAAVVPGAAAAIPAVSTDTARTSAASGFSYQEDRSKWIPPHRLSEETTARRTADTQLAEANRKLAAYRAEAGIAGPVDAAATKKAEVEAAFNEMFPHLTKESQEKRDAALARADAVEAQQWKRHGTTQLNAVYTQVADALGAESLNADQKSDLQESFANWLRSTCAKELQASGGTESATLTAYEEGDAKVLGEFVKRYTANWVEPARRKVTAQTLGRSRPVPDSTGRAQVTSIKRPEKFANMDARLDYAAERFKELGGRFER